MGGAAAVRGARRRLAAAAVVAIATLLAVLLAASGARAAELLYFENDPLQSQLAVVDLGTGAASLLNTTGAEIEDPEGVSYDPVTNRLYVAGSGGPTFGLISYVNLDGSGGGTMPLPPGTPVVKDPRGAVVDPVGRVVYWLNDTVFGPETISWARLDGSEGGNLELGGQPIAPGTERLTVDPAAGRLYWGYVTDTANGSIHYAPLVGRAGTAGALKVESNGHGADFQGIAVDSPSNRLFWVEFGIDSVWTAGLTGTEKSEAVQGSAPINLPDGLAFDPDQNRLYWANFGVENNAKGGLGTAVLGAPASEITPTGVTVSLPQSVLVIKSPRGLVLPSISSTPDGVMTCSPGTWAGDYVASFVYQSPRSFSYQWTLNEEPIAGATATTFTPSVSGRYKCVVTATNQAGATSRTSPGVQATVTTPPAVVRKVTRPRQTNSKPAKLELLGKARHLKARPGKLLTLKVRTTNQGTVASNPAKLCLKLTKGARRALRAGRCQRLGALKGGATVVAKLRLRVKRKAQPGLYRLRIAAPGDQIKVTVRVR